MIDLDALEANIKQYRNVGAVMDWQQAVALIKRLREADAGKAELKAWADVAVDDLRARLHEAETESQRLLNRLSGGMKLAHQAKTRRLEAEIERLEDRMKVVISLLFEFVPLKQYAEVERHLDLILEPRPAHDPVGSHESL